MKMVQLWDLRNKHYGFTLAEAVITLGLVSAVLLIPTINYKQQLPLQQEQLTMINFENNWNNTLKSAFLKQTGGNIQFDNTKHQIRYHLIGTNDNQIQKFPTDLEFEIGNIKNSKNSISFKTADSVMPQTIKAYSKSSQKYYSYTIQMGWGRLIAKKT
ncbi:hypothetical protein [Bombilactobacillus thymidiniphilus]|uniref:Prepilin-type N-terminal cleavage/methylation domain-containing protein n=1 Tax=Bombilactobacillus thymidiniphilus TaxID=2923363 RepID=A0ABY4PDF4_9LACO|nr:hypothetical protein [Bombilactobacillus thymidiniphilus]UQS83803.1 hypothetical protein MOO47_00955 [Bombilactobacillus thymidiniphilus]